MLLGSIHPAMRLAIGVVVVVAGMVMHKVFLDVIGAAVVVIGAWQWLARGRGGAGSGGFGGFGGMRR